MIVYMVRDAPVPSECLGDPVGVFSTRELAQNYIDVSRLGNDWSAYWIDEWTVDGADL